LLSFSCQHTSTSDIYTLSLHDALPIYRDTLRQLLLQRQEIADAENLMHHARAVPQDHLASRHLADVLAEMTVRHKENLEVLRHRSEEHTSELQSPCNLVCRLLLEKKK